VSKISSDPFDAANEAIARGDPQAAITMLRVALAGRPAKALAWVTLGALLRGRGELDESIVCFVKATVLRPLRDRFASTLCAALRADGRFDEARVEAERFMSLVREGHAGCGPNHKRVFDACVSGSPK